MRALVVEDVPTLSIFLEHLLKKEGFAVDRAGMAQEGENSRATSMTTMRWCWTWACRTEVA